MASGQGVFMTRNEDAFLDLKPRSYLLNKNMVDLAVSIHCNASTNRAANYIATFIQGVGGQAEILAKHVQSKLVAATGWPDGGVRVQNLHMTRETQMPAILVECGFISNPDQEAQLRSVTTRDKLAKAIAEGIGDYLGPSKEQAMRIIVKGKEIEGKSIDGVTWVPLREIVELLNEKVEWQGPDKPVIVE